MEIHTIPVPRGWSVEQAWEAISRGALLTDPEPQGWANVEVRDGVMVRVLPVSDEPKGDDDVRDAIRTRSFPECKPRCDLSLVSTASLASGGPCPRCGKVIPGDRAARVLNARRLEATRLLRASGGSDA